MDHLTLVVLLYPGGMAGPAGQDSQAASNDDLRYRAYRLNLVDQVRCAESQYLFIMW